MKTTSTLSSSSDGKGLPGTQIPLIMSTEELDNEDFYLEELVNEPVDSIVASRVMVWAYRRDGQITHLAIAGHANAPVCKQVSASLFNAILDCPDELIPNAMFVPGAFLLPASGSSLKKQPTFSLEDLVYKQLAPLQDATGLVKLHIIESDYVQIVANLRNQIDKARNDSSPCLICHSDQQAKPHLIFIPFYRLNSKDLSPLALELDLKLFDSSEFQRLLEIHRIEIRHELIRDAERRKRTFEEWRDRDIESLHHAAREAFEILLPNASARERSTLAKEYAQVLLSKAPETVPDFWVYLPPQVRSSLMVSQTKNLRNFLETKKNKVFSSEQRWELAIKSLQHRDRPVRGARNYEDATVTDADGVLYISRQESMEWNLPDLIRQDKAHIAYMEALLQKFNETDPHRESKIDALNMGTLLDAFLRNWPPIFLANQSAQSIYKDWCSQQRDSVWNEIHSKLKQQYIRIEPLQTENVIFAIQYLSSRRIRITPYYITADNEFMIYVDSQYGIPYYVNNWQHHHKMLLANWQKLDLRDECEKLYKEGSLYLENGSITEATWCFKQALRLHPALAAEKILEGFWSNTSQEAGTYLQELSKLIGAISSFDENRPKALENLSHFVKVYPNFLPDPYLLMGYHLVEEKSAVPNAKREYDKAVREYDKAVDQLKTMESRYTELMSKVTKLQKEYSEKLARLIADKILIPAGANRYNINLKTKRKTNSRSRLEQLKRLQVDLEHASTSSRDLRSEIDNRAKNIEPLYQRIADLREKLSKTRRSVWASLRKYPNDHLIRAAALNPEYFAEVCQGEIYIPSWTFSLHVSPIYDILKADEYLHIQSMLSQGAMSPNGNLIDQLADKTMHEQKQLLQELISVIREIIRRVIHLSEQEISPLKDYCKLLEQFNIVDTLAREMMIRHQLEDIERSFVHRAYKLYNNAASRIPEITEARKRLSINQYLFACYGFAVDTLIGVDTSPVKNGFPNAKFSILESKPFVVARVGINEETKTIFVETANGLTQSVLQFDGLSREDCKHLLVEFEKPGYVQKIKATGLTPAYAILLTPIEITQKARNWKNSLSELETWLNLIFAYVGIPPAKSDLVSTQEALTHFDKMPVVERIILNYQGLREQFLSAIDPDHKAKVVLIP